MKKTLKVIASAAIAMSAFASVAMADDAATTTTSTSTDTSATTAPATKTSADFKDLANVDAGLKAKIDALLKAGVFEGTAADEFGIDQNMTRAQFAKVLDLIYGVNVDTSVQTSSFSDVKADDQANGWAIPYIEAAKKAGLIDGVSDTTFVPGDNVTLGQFATALVKGLGVKPDMTGTPWYADAVKQAIAKNVLPADTDGSKLATRADLVVGAFGGQQAYQDANKPAAVSVVSAKATGVKTVTVTLDRDVDTSKATVALASAGSNAIATTTSWSDDKKTATLTLTDTSIRAGDYTVTLGGLDASAIKTATGTFTAQDEQVQKIEFVSASDTIAYSTKTIVKIKPTNQYGEIASTAAGNYDTYGGYVQKLSKDADGYLLATVDSTGGGSTTQGVSVIPITIVNSDSHVTATKNFTVGVKPIPTKLELGTAQYSNGTSISGTGDNVKFPFDLYDQYGSIIPYDTITSDPNYTNPPTIVWSDYLGSTDAASVALEDDGNNMPLLKISLNKNIDKAGDYNFTLIEQAASVSGKISIKSSQVATKIKIGDLGDVIAAGDVDAYVPLTAYDAEGNELSVDDIVNDTNSADNNNDSRIKVSGGTLQRTGEHRGTIHVTGIPTSKNGVVTVTAYIASANVSSTDTKSFTVQGARIPDHIKEVTAPAKEAIAGSFSKFKYQVIDQYGKALDHLLYVDSNGNASKTAANGYSKYSVSVSAITYNTNPATETLVPVSPGGVVSDAKAAVTTDSDYSSSLKALYGSTDGSTVNGAVVYSPDVSTTDIADFNKHTLRFTTTADSAGYTVEFVADIQKNDKSQTKLSKKISVIKSGASELDNLTYSLNAVATLFNAKDSGVVQDTTWDVGQTLSKGSESSLTKDQLRADSKLGREVTVSGKSPSGDTVSVPRKITKITSSNTAAANVYFDSASNRAYVIGNKVGSANVAVTFIAADGSSKTLTTPITVKDDALNVTKLAWDHDSFNTQLNFNAFGDSVGDAYGTKYGLNVTDNYGVGYSRQDAQKYNYLLGVNFSTDNVKGGTVTIDQYGNVIVTTDGTLKDDSSTPYVVFDLTATSATGQTATTSITAKSTTAINFSY